MSSARAVCKCVVNCGKRGSQGNLDVTLLATVVILEVPAVLPLSPPAGAGVAPATPTPSCCSVKNVSRVQKNRLVV